MVYSVQVPPEDCLSVYYAPSPCPSLFRDMGSLRLVSTSLLGQKNPVDLVEEVPEHLAPLPGSYLDDQNEFVQVDINFFHGGGVIIHWEVLPAGMSLGRWGADVVVGRSGLVHQIQQVLVCLLPLGDHLVCEVGHRLHRHAKIGGTVNVSHGEGEVEAH